MRILQVSQNARAIVTLHPFARRIQIKDTPDWKLGPRGFAMCRWCDQEVPNKRRCYCDDKCVREFMLRCDPGYVRRCLFDKERGVCQACGFDTVKALALIRKSKPVFTYKQFQIHTWKVMDKKHQKLCEKYIQMGFPHPREAWWAADHIVPVIEGGGLCGLEGFQTLCIPCHKLETAKLAKRRSKPSNRPKSANLHTNLL